MMGNKSEFWLRLEKLTDEKIEESNGKLNRAKIAREIGTNPTTFSEWINGNKEPQMKSAVALAKYVNVSTDYLFGLSDYADKQNEAITLKSVGLSEKAARKLQEAMADEQTAKWANFFFSSNFPKNIATTMAQYSCARFASGVYELYNRTKDDTILTQNGFNQAVSDLFGEKTLLGMSEPEKELSFNMFRAITSDYDSNLIRKLIRGFGGSLGLTRLYELQAEQLMRNLLMWSLNEAMTTYYKMELDRLETE